MSADSSSASTQLDGTMLRLALIQHFLLRKSKLILGELFRHAQCAEPQSDNFKAEYWLYFSGAEMLV